MNSRLPAMCFPPGEHLKDELEARSVSVESFSAVVGVDVEIVNAIINGSQRVDVHLAKKLGSALGVSPAFWSNLQKSYDLWFKEYQKTDEYKYEYEERNKFPQKH